MDRITLKIEGMHCNACSDRLEKGLMKKNHILKATASFEKKEVIVEYEKISKEKVEEYIEDIGFKSIGE